MPPGFYRYSIISYNLFNVPKAQSEWEEFTIFKAYKPRVNDTSVSVNLNSNIYLDYKNDGIISFGGRNLFMPPESPDDISFSEYVLKSTNGRTVKPLEILERADNGHKITFKFDMNDLESTTCLSPTPADLPTIPTRETFLPSDLKNGWT